MNNTAQRVYGCRDSIIDFAAGHELYKEKGIDVRNYLLINELINDIKKFI